MTHPKEAKHLADKEIDENLRDLFPLLVELEKWDLRAYCGAIIAQAKAYNTVKAERDALKEILKACIREEVFVHASADLIMAVEKCQTIRGEG